MPVLCRRLKSKDHAASDFESESLLISLLLGVFVKNLTNASGKNILDRVKTRNLGSKTQVFLVNLTSNLP